MDELWDEEDWCTEGTAVAVEAPAAPESRELERCPDCDAPGFALPGKRPADYSPMCATCEGVGWTVPAPDAPTAAIPGSEDKIAVMAARYRAGLPLYNERDATLENYRPARRASP